MYHIHTSAYPGRYTVIRGTRVTRRLPRKRSRRIRSSVSRWHRGRAARTSVERVQTKHIAPESERDRESYGGIFSLELDTWRSFRNKALSTVVKLRTQHLLDRDTRENHVSNVDMLIVRREWSGKGENILPVEILKLISSGKYNRGSDSWRLYREM